MYILHLSASLRFYSLMFAIGPMISILYGTLLRRCNRYIKNTIMPHVADIHCNSEASALPNIFILDRTLDMLGYVIHCTGCTVD